MCLLWLSLYEGRWKTLVYSSAGVRMSAPNVPYFRECRGCGEQIPPEKFDEQTGYCQDCMDAEGDNQKEITQ